MSGFDPDGVKDIFEANSALHEAEQFLENRVWVWLRGVVMEQVAVRSALIRTIPRDVGDFLSREHAIGEQNGLELVIRVMETQVDNLKARISKFNQLEKDDDQYE